MRKVFLGGIAVIALATLINAGADRASAQSADSRSTDARASDNLEKENAALRARIRRLELEKENAALRARLGQLEPQRQAAQQSPAPARTPAMASGQPVTLSPAVASAQPVALGPGLVDYANEMELKAPPLTLPPLYSWTGFYAGVNVGYSVGNDRASATLAAPAIPSTLTSPADVAIVPMGVFGGGQVGYNWQGGPHWLFGVEADFQGSQQKDTDCLLNCENNPGNGVNVGASLSTLTAQHQIDYFGTMRGRVGYVNNNTLFYVTGGGAYGRVEQTLAATQSVLGTGTFSSATTAQNNFGYAVGGGIEAALGGNWTGKIEYLYMSLGSISTTVAGGLPPAPITPFTLSATSTVRDNIIRVGLNYRFGAGPAPEVLYNADLPVPGNGPLVTYAWTGPYAGANVGYGFGDDPVSQLSPATIPPGGPFTITSTANTTVAPTGLIGGAQVGYNWQGGRNWLVGVEADFQGSSQTDTGCTPLICFNQTNAAGTFTDFITVQQTLDYFGTLRGRVGAINNNILYYATGGVAYGHVTENVNVNSSSSVPAIFTASSSAADLIGFVVGGGIEAALWGGWTGKVEYLYMNLGSISNTVNISVPGVLTETVTTNSTVRDNIVRLGANYHF
jgi:outer membrane immunogenic protein